GMSIDVSCPEPLCDLFRIPDGQGIGDAGARQSGYVLREPGQARSLIRQTLRMQGEAVSYQSATLNLDVPELDLNILDDAIVGRRRSAQHRHVGRHLAQDADQAPVIRPEVVAPIRNAMRFIHYQKPDIVRNRLQYTRDKFLAGKALWR